eukprot:TRINITY_DN66937_c0_g1_i1.p1 TRINITY_DN66937_c0_g1~~TRINITY_DN66937_c0_g1_i1.p1  ORF type:complete len:187 (+),score=37.61 TRINITY_DN66937_c0_g1_i1:30-563(+)
MAEGHQAAAVGSGISAVRRSRRPLGLNLAEDRSLEPFVLAPGLAQVARLDANPRNADLESLFHVLDVDQDGNLCSDELCAFARPLGYEGSSQDFFQEEFMMLCRQFEQEASSGINLETFLRLVNDERGPYFVPNDWLPSTFESNSTVEACSTIRSCTSSLKSEEGSAPESLPVGSAN